MSVGAWRARSRNAAPPSWSQLHKSRCMALLHNKTRRCSFWPISSTAPPAPRPDKTSGLPRLSTRASSERHCLPHLATGRSIRMLRRSSTNGLRPPERCSGGATSSLVPAFARPPSAAALIYGEAVAIRRTAPALVDPPELGLRNVHHLEDGCIAVGSGQPASRVGHLDIDDGS